MRYSNPLIVFQLVQYLSRSLRVTCNWLLQASSTRPISSFHHLNTDSLTGRHAVYCRQRRSALTAARNVPLKSITDLISQVTPRADTAAATSDLFRSSGERDRLDQGGEKQCVKLDNVVRARGTPSQWGNTPFVQSKSGSVWNHMLGEKQMTPTLMWIRLPPLLPFHLSFPSPHSRKRVSWHNFLDSRSSVQRGRGSQVLIRRQLRFGR